MPELTVTFIAIIFGALLVGIVLGWLVRGSRAGSEKAAINDGWQEQLEAQRVEHSRLVDQNKSLMEQNSQYQASNKDAKMRASELSDALKEAFERRDELQRQLKDIRGNLEKAVTERDQLKTDADGREDGQSKLEARLERRDARIEKLNAEIKNWGDRLPPLMDRYKQRDEDAIRLEAELADANERIRALETMVGSEQTRVEPVDADALGDAIDASNEPMDTHVEEVVDVDGAEDLIEADEFVEDGEAEELIEAEAFIEPSDDDDDDATEISEMPDDVVEALATHNDVAQDDDPAPRDDLKLIKGVGPAIEKTLNELGIRRFDQIAAMSEYDIDRVANRLKGFRSRIYREDWIGQARELQDQKASGQ